MGNLSGCPHAMHEKKSLKEENMKNKYVISDIHGCYEEYIKLLEKIQFSQDDELYVLGDVVDRGPEPIKVLQDMMLRPNVYPILGNHDYMALKVLKKLNVEIREDNVDNHLDGDDLIDYLYWMQDGGNTTLEQFRKLSMNEKGEILEYLQDFSVCEEIFIDNKRFILVHADLYGFEENKNLDDYALGDFIFRRAEYGKRYFKDENTIIVTGHTPTVLIREDKMPLVYRGNGHLAIDCGCVYGERLAAYCLDDGRVVYVEKGK